MLVDSLEAPVTVVVDVDPDEHARRTKWGLGALADLRTVAALWELPQALETPKASVPAGLRPRLDNMPAGVVESVGGAWIRSAGSPLRIHGALGWAASWRLLTVTLGAFVTVAPRAAVVPLRSRSDRVRAEALLWGIGLVSGESEPSVLLAPQPPRVEFGPYQWWLAECAYAAWLRLTTLMPTR